MNATPKRLTAAEKREIRRFARNLERSINKLCRGQAKRPIPLPIRLHTTQPNDAA